jgi:hypothetical protein
MPRNDGTGPQGQGPLPGQSQTFGQRIVSGFRNVFGSGQRQGLGRGGGRRGQGRGAGRGRKR